jgi:hypothetical protein
MALTYLAAKLIQGVAADTKPTNVPAGSIFIETDTNGTLFIHDGSAWQRKDQRNPSSYIAYKDGSTTNVVNTRTGKIDYTDSDATTALNSALAATKSTGKRLGLMSNDTFTLTGTLNLSSQQAIGGESPFGLSRLNVTGDYPAITISESSANQNRTIVDSLYITHSNATMPNTTGSILLSTTTGHNVTSTDIKNCYFYDGGTNKGNAIKFNINDAPIYKVNVYNCEIYGFYDQILVNYEPAIPDSATDWMSNNSFHTVNFWNPVNTGFMIDGVTPAQFISNHFINCWVQSVASTQCGFDLSTNSTVSQWSNNCFTNCMVWDLAAGRDAYKFNSVSEVTMVGCTPTNKIGGTGATNGKVIKFDTYTHKEGIATFSGDGSTKTFDVTTNLVTTGGTVTPTFKSVKVEPQTSDSLGSTWITYSDVSEFTINFAIAPPSGTDNVKFYWMART